MHETGATEEQIEAATRRVFEQGWGNRKLVSVLASALVPHDHRIVPADSIILTPEEAALARESVDAALKQHQTLRVKSTEIGFEAISTVMRSKVDQLRALAEKLGGV